jgi:hypothetical protein
MIEDKSPMTGASVEIPGLKVEVTKDDSWQTIGMIVALIFAVYVGIKLINKIFNKWK